VSSVIGLFYYLRVVGALYAPAPGAITSERSASLFASRFGLGALTVLLVCFGIWPGVLWPALTAAANSLR